ncbi:MAG: leucine-rich repeat domain-containing protein [Bacteroidales bacterium]
MKQKLLFMLFIIQLIIPQTSLADTVTVNNITYETNDDDMTASITGYSGDRPSGELILPNTITSNDNEYTVTSIGSSAFKLCMLLTSIDLPDGLTKIGDEAFYFCSDLKSIDFPDGVTEIGNYAFFYCADITSIDLPDGLTEISSSALMDCRSLTSITVSENNSVYCSSDGVLFDKALTTLVIYPVGKTDTYYCVPNSVTEIGNASFCGCLSITSIDLPEGLTEIKEWTFAKCSSLTSIDLPKGVTKIGYNAFGYCNTLSSVVLPDGLTVIDSTAFHSCFSLTSIDLPNGLTEIGSYAFCSCSLTSIDFPESLTEIGSSAFDFCSNLTDIKVNWEIPLTVTSTEVFSTYASATLSVPVGTLEAYKADPYWGQFINIVEDSSLAVDKNLTDETKLYVTNNGTLNISGAVDGVAVKVYNLNGGVVANGVVLDSTAQIELPITNGVYIVTIGNKSYKVIR